MHKDQWEIFKAEFDGDMEQSGIALGNLTVKNFLKLLLKKKHEKDNLNGNSSRLYGGLCYRTGKFRR